ncbi:hypothetical protein [Vulcanisaeta thermophila]|uniref:hypothetical protein n=1 Tax=Vulcanisaeta thermophila TaxID=867917 RepID=UPI0008537E0F|nr:hypothetical protein [Vulcanisaeta thermophila]
MMIVVTSGAKGGTGKSTVSLGLSVVLSMRGYRHTVYDYSCVYGECTGVAYYLGDWVDAINRVSRVVRIVRGAPSGDGFGDVSIVDLPPMSVAQESFVELLRRADALVLVQSYEPDSILAGEAALQAFPGNRVVRLCNRAPAGDCKYHLKLTPESPFFVVGEPSNFKSLLNVADELGFAGEGFAERVGREFNVGGFRVKLVSRWDPYGVVGIEQVKWYYVAIPLVTTIGEAIRRLWSLISPEYLGNLGLAEGSLRRLFRRRLTDS